MKKKKSKNSKQKPGFKRILMDFSVPVRTVRLFDKRLRIQNMSRRTWFAQQVIRWVDPSTPLEALVSTSSPAFPTPQPPINGKALEAIAKQQADNTQVLIAVLAELHAYRVLLQGAAPPEAAAQAIKIADEASLGVLGG